MSLVYLIKLLEVLTAFLGLLHLLVNSLMTVGTMTLRFPGMVVSLYCSACHLDQRLDLLLKNPVEFSVSSVMAEGTVFHAALMMTMELFHSVVYLTVPCCYPQVLLQQSPELALWRAFDSAVMFLEMAVGVVLVPTSVKMIQRELLVVLAAMVFRCYILMWLH